ncbi:hypothetical protein ACKWTF_011666 [Chironomus riparius]
MKSLIIFAAFLIFSVESEICGNLNQSENQWPWTVSIFSNSSNMVLCQASIISNKHILTAGHCLQNMNPSGIQVYPGFMSHRRTDNHQLVWQVEQINLHPDMKLTSRGRFINGGFVASMAIHADLAIATLKQEIEFNDVITSICLPIDDSILNIEIHGSYSGWNKNVKNVESLNTTIDAIGDAEIFEVDVDEKRIDFVTGTGFYSRINSSWMIVGLMTIRESENDTEMNKFISIHKYVNWITNLTQSTSLPSTNSSFNSNVETSTTSTDSSSSKTSSESNSTTISPSNVETTAHSSTSALPLTKLEPKVNSTNIQQSTSVSIDEHSSSTQSFKTTDQQTKITNLTRKASQENASSTQKTTPSMPDTIQTTSKFDILALSSAVPDMSVSQNLQSTKAPFTEPSTPSHEKKSTSRISSISQESTLPRSTETPLSLLSDAVTREQISISSNSTSTTPQKLISTVENKIENSTPLISTNIDMLKTDTTTTNERAPKSMSASEKTIENALNDVTGLNVNIDSVTEIPKHIVSNLQAVYNRSFSLRLPEGRDLKDFTNNVDQLNGNLSTISNSLPSIILTTLTTTTGNPTEKDIMATTFWPSLNSVFNISEASPSIMNSTDSNDNSTTTIRSEAIVIGGIELTPAMIITAVCVASLLILFTVFGVLSFSKPIAH